MMLKTIIDRSAEIICISKKISLGVVAKKSEVFELDGIHKVLSEAEDHELFQYKKYI